MNNELLARIEKLEQAIQDIWASCSCLRKDPEDEWEEPEHECEDGCPDCSGCYEPTEEPEEPIEEEDHD